MKTTTKIRVAMAAAFAFGAPAANADLICDRCEYFYFGTYLGNLYPGDKATFKNTAIVHDIELQLGSGLGHSRQFDNYWTFDVGNNAPRAAITISTKAPTALAGPHFWVELYADTGGAMTCEVQLCTTDFSKIDFEHPLVSTFTAGNRITFRTGELLPGRYFIRLAAGTRATGESAYSGTLNVRAQ